MYDPCIKVHRYTLYLRPYIDPVMLIATNEIHIALINMNVFYQLNYLAISYFSNIILHCLTFLAINFLRCVTVANEEQRRNFLLSIGGCLLDPCTFPCPFSSNSFFPWPFCDSLGLLSFPFCSSMCLHSSRRFTYGRE